MTETGTPRIGNLDEFLLTVVDGLPSGPRDYEQRHFGRGCHRLPLHLAIHDDRRLDSVTDRLEQREALRRQRCDHAVEPVGPVQHRQIGALQALGGRPQHLRQLLDDELVERDAVLGRRSLRRELGGVGLGPRQRDYAFRFGLGRPDDLRHQLGLAELGILLRHPRLFDQHLLLGPGRRQRPGLSRGLLGLVHLGLVARLGDGGLPGVLGPVAHTLLMRHRTRLVGLGLGHLGVLVDPCLVRRGEGLDVTRALVVDAADLQRIDGEADPRHLGLARVHNGVGQGLLLADDRLHRHRADDAAQVSAEDPSHQRRHLALITLEPAGGGRNRLVVIADLERDDRLHRQRQALLGVAVLGDLRLLHRQGQPGRLGQDRHYEHTVPRHDLERECVRTSLLAPAHQQRLVGSWDAITQHLG